MDFILRHKIVTALILIVLVVVAWYELSAGPSSSSSSLLTTTSANASGPDQKLVSTLLTLRAVTLSGTIFSDPAFGTLKDFTTQIKSEPVGRSDPFAPIATTSAATQTSSSNNTNTKLFAPKK